MKDYFEFYVRVMGYVEIGFVSYVNEKG